MDVKLYKKIIQVLGVAVALLFPALLLINLSFFGQKDDNINTQPPICGRTSVQGMSFKRIQRLERFAPRSCHGLCQ